MSLLRGLFGERGGRRDEPTPAVVVRDVGHRVFIERPPVDVWPHLVAPGPGADLGVDCVRVLPLPSPGPGRLPEFAGVWRRSNGRLWAGLSTVVDVEHVHGGTVSVREQVALLQERLRRTGGGSFRALTADCAGTLEVVARFLALLELYREGLVAFDQAAALGELRVRWTGQDQHAGAVDEGAAP